MSIARTCKITRMSFQFLNKLQPLWWLLMRLWIASIFFKAGLTKIDDFETTILLFSHEYQVPLLSPYFAAISATVFELLCPVLLVLGLATRFSAFSLLIMTAVIQFTVFDNVQHYYWALLLSGLVLYGAGPLSLDYLFARKKNLCPRRES